MLVTKKNGNRRLRTRKRMHDPQSCLPLPLAQTRPSNYHSFSPAWWLKLTPRVSLRALEDLRYKQEEVMLENTYYVCVRSVVVGGGWWNEDIGRAFPCWTPENLLRTTTKKKKIMIDNDVCNGDGNGNAVVAPTE